jgi:hypothetical protein
MVLFQLLPFKNNLDVFLRMDRCLAKRVISRRIDPINQPDNPDVNLLNKLFLLYDEKVFCKKLSNKLSFMGLSLFFKILPYNNLFYPPQENQQGTRLIYRIPLMRFASLSRKAEFQGELNGIQTKDNYDFYMVVMEVIMIDIFFFLYDKYQVINNLKICDDQRRLYQRLGQLFSCVLSKTFGHREIDPLFQGKIKEMEPSGIPCIEPKVEISEEFNMDTALIVDTYKQFRDNVQPSILEQVKLQIGKDPVGMWIFLTCLPQDRIENGITVRYDSLMMGLFISLEEYHPN